LSTILAPFMVSFFGGGMMGFRRGILVAVF